MKERTMGQNGAGREREHAAGKDSQLTLCRFQSDRSWDSAPTPYSPLQNPTKRLYPGHQVPEMSS